MTASYDWLRSYTALARLGYVNSAIEACEELWASEFEGNVAAVDAIRKVPEYDAYAQALRRTLTFPLRLFRVTTAEAYETWRATHYSKPVATTVSLEFAHLVEEVYPAAAKELVLITGALTNPEAVIMRGRISLYEIVVDSGQVDRIEVSLLADTKDSSLPSGR